MTENFSEKYPNQEDFQQERTKLLRLTKKQDELKEQLDDDDIPESEYDGEMQRISIEIQGNLKKHPELKTLMRD